MHYIDEDVVISLDSDHVQWWALSRAKAGSDVAIAIDGDLLRAILVRRKGGAGDASYSLAGPPIKLFLSPVPENKRLKYWRPARNDHVAPADKASNPAITLCADGLREKDDERRVIQIEKNGPNVVFRERCDDYYCVHLAPETAIAALEEAIQWIRKNANPLDEGGDTT